jgi:RNA polymerase sigma factor (sigma-70 family)
MAASREPADAPTSGEAGSISRHLARVRDGDTDSLSVLWERYYRALLTVARQRLGPRHRRMADEDDVVNRAFESFYAAISQGRLPDVRNRDGLWRVLLTITANQATDEIRRQNAAIRGGGNVMGDSGLRRLNPHATGDPFHQILSEDPTPEFVIAVQEEFQKRLAVLPNQELRDVALRKLEGYLNREIADELGVSPRWVERKLQTIRTLWLDLEDTASHDG